MSRKIDPSYINFMVKEFNRSLVKDLHYVYVGYQHIDGEKQHFQKPRSEWLDVLDKVMDKAILLEEYEACAELKKIREKICIILAKKNDPVSSSATVYRN